MTACAARRPGQAVRPHPGNPAPGRPLACAPICDLAALGERQIVIDCDVLQADGGTRTASITGGYVALASASAFMKKTGMVTAPVLKDHVAAVSCGIVKGEPVLDLDYDEDSTAETDANFVLTGSGGLVEIQGTAEGAPFSEERVAGRCCAWRARASANWSTLQKQALGMKLPRGVAAGGRPPQPGKVREIKALLAPHGIEPVSARPNWACRSRKKPARPSPPMPS